MSNYFNDMYYESVEERVDQNEDGTYNYKHANYRELDDMLNKQSSTSNNNKPWYELTPEERLDRAYKNNPEKYSKEMRKKIERKNKLKKLKKLRDLKAKQSEVKECVTDLIFSAYTENVIDTDEVKMLLESTDLDMIIEYLDE